VNDSVGFDAVALLGSVVELWGSDVVGATAIGGTAVGTVPHPFSAAMIISAQLTSHARRPAVAGGNYTSIPVNSLHEPVGGPSSPDTRVVASRGGRSGASIPVRPHGLEDNPMSSVSSVSPRTLADVVPGGLVRSIALVIGGAIFVGLTAQVSIPLPFTPVPLTLQTFSVLLVGAALGSVRGVCSMALYLLAGVAGVPWFANQQSGWAFVSFGYVLGFVAAAWLVGWLAERGADRRVVPTIGMMALGNLVIYVFGIAGLMVLADMSFVKALTLGVLPFLIGDAIKILLAAGLLPGTWKLINSRHSS
jgi:biotin transport system substrate-specific component